VSDSFQAFADATGITTNFRIGNRSICKLAEIFDAWRCVTPASEWECGEVVEVRRRRGVVVMRLSYGGVVTLKVRR
jgi:hypothetical protein